MGEIRSCPTTHQPQTSTSKPPWTAGKRLPKGRACSGQTNEIRNAAGRRLTSTERGYKNQRAHTSEPPLACQTAAED